MKGKSWLLCLALIMPILSPFADMRARAVSYDDIYSACAVLMDAETGQVLFDKNMNTRAYPASTTKIMTGIIAVEKCFPGEILTVSESALDIDEPESSNIALSPGEELSFDSAMFALMLPSANDAANVIAEHVAGSQEEFVRLMNEKAALLGAADTHFTNAHGLHDDGHYTTAYDLALITRYAAGNESFMRYFGADLYTMPPTNLQPAERPFTNYQYMLVNTTIYYNEDVFGGKVGYTGEAKHTMSTIARRDGRTLICITLGSANRREKFKDTQRLLDFGFDEFSRVTVPADRFSGFSVPLTDSGNDAGEALFTAGSDFAFLLHNSADPLSLRFDYTAPDFIEKGDKAEAAVSLFAENGEELVPELLAVKPLKVEIIYKAVPLFVTADVPENENDAILKTGNAFYIAVLVCSAALFAFSMLMLRRYNIYRRRKARMQRFNKRMAANLAAGE